MVSAWDPSEALGHEWDRICYRPRADHDQSEV